MGDDCNETNDKLTMIFPNKLRVYLDCELRSCNYNIQQAVGDILDDENSLFFAYSTLIFFFIVIQARLYKLTTVCNEDNFKCFF